MVAGVNGHVYCLDNCFKWEGGHYQVYANTPLEKFVTEIEGNTHHPAFIEKVFTKLNGQVDFMFIDGDHSYEGVKQDFWNYLPLLKEGGYVAFHDIVDSEHHRSKGCFVAPFWQEVKYLFGPDNYWEFIDNNEYGVERPHSMGIGVLRKAKRHL